MSATSAHPSAARLPRARLNATDLRARAADAAPLVGLLALCAALYLWALSRNGYANEYYAAAVQAGTHSWKAFLFGSLDASNYITVDKPPASLWLIELSTRVFGFSSFSMLLPQALAGVGSVALLYATVRRRFGSPAALLSGLALAITPVAALMFRFNNPDALLVLLLVAGAYCVTRATEDGRTKWLAFAGALIGLAFLTKMMQAFVVLPAFAAAYLIAAPVPLRRRLWQLGVGGAAVLVAAGWWVALVELWPASARPYIGGSTNNSILELVFGYNGLGRLTGSGGGGGGGASFSGSPGILRLFNAELGSQISWLLPAALIALVAGTLYSVRRRRVGDGQIRTGLALWGGWLLATAAVYSVMSGVIHPYYTNTLAPPIAVLTGVGSVLLWRRRERLPARLTLATMLGATGAWAFALLDRTPNWHPWLRYAVLVAAVSAAIVVLVRGAWLKRRAAGALAATALLAALAAPAAFTLNAIASVQTGSNPMAGPASASQSGFGGARTMPSGAGAMPSGSRTMPSGAGAMPSEAPGGSTSRPGGGGGGSVSTALATRLEQNASRYRWAAATSSAQTAASIELSTGTSVMAVGGFTGSDNSTTLAHFKQLVAEGKIHYYLAAGGMAGGGVGGANSRANGQSVVTQIESWVSKHFKSITVGGTTVYDLTQATSS